VRVLLNANANVHACGPESVAEDALLGATSHSHIETMRVLLQHNADVHARGWTWEGANPEYAVRSAAQNDRPEAVELLIQAGASADCLPLSFVRKFLEYAPDAETSIDNMARCLRMGVHKLNALHAQLDVSGLLRCRKEHVSALAHRHTLCHDLVEFIFIYV